MTRHLRCATLVLFGGLASLTAQSTGFSGAVSLAKGTPSMVDLTGNGLGFVLEGAWDAPSTMAPFRVGLSLSRFGAGDHEVGMLDADENKVQVPLNGPSLTTLQVYVAARVDLRPDTVFTFGVSANQHRLGTGYPEVDGQRPEKGLKFGLRAGIGYALNARTTLEATFQWVEVAKAPDAGSMHAPSWFQVGARWHF